MQQLNLAGSWNFRCVSKDVFPNEVFSGTVPGSMYVDLLALNKIPDPFYKENEYEVAHLSDHDWVYERTFIVEKSLLNETIIELVFEGLDTLAQITLNGTLLAKTSDMHRTYIFDVAHLLKEGENSISILFKSPTKYMLAEYARQPLVGGAGGQYKGFNYLRKSHSMGGWDWGPVLPDVGIWRPVSIQARSTPRFEDVYITQEHTKKSETQTDVELKVRVRLDKKSLGATGINGARGNNGANASQSNTPVLRALCEVWSPAQNDSFKAGADDGDAKVVNASYTGEALIDPTAHETFIIVKIPEAQLWWPNNLGEQPLYEVRVSVQEAESGSSQLAPNPAESGSSQTFDSRTYRIGLRTLTVLQEDDQWGRSFAITVNGVSFFAMGADYVPEDSLITRNTRERTERLIKSVAQANHNCIRVWGGANYPEDDFFDLCDEYGLVVWQDFMMACGVYELSDQFRENIVAEMTDNVKRIRHHASLGLWCGNNEQEEGWNSWGWSEQFSLRLKADYIKLYEEIMPNLMKELDPQTFYWLASPSSGGSFDKPNDENYGDMHNWTVWHGLKPYASYRTCYTRFMSEFGIESFPPMRTIESFAEPSDMNIFSPVMENHQKCDSGNVKMLFYIGETYKYPKDFDSLVYASQLGQAEGMRYGVEHWRRNRNNNRCMGAVYWQLNDCWPVASWASIDFYGRWKALHYVSKQFFAPVLASAVDEGTKVALHVTNETHLEVRGTLLWRLMDDSRTINGTAVLEMGKIAVCIPRFTNQEVFCRDFADVLGTLPILGNTNTPYSTSAHRNAYLMYEFIEDSKTAGHKAQTSSGSVLFVPSKHFNYLNEGLSFTVSDATTYFELELRAASYSRFIELSTLGIDALFSDNYFDLGAGDTKTVRIAKSEIFSDSPAEGTVAPAMSTEEFAQTVRVRSVVDFE